MVVEPQQLFIVKHNNIFVVHHESIFAESHCFSFLAVTISITLLCLHIETRNLPYKLRQADELKVLAHV
jgi:hypothetical protein